jgi:hypothetical protein
MKRKEIIMKRKEIMMKRKEIMMQVLVGLGLNVQGVFTGSFGGMLTR